MIWRESQEDWRESRDDWRAETGNEAKERGEKRGRNSKGKDVCAKDMAKSEQMET